MIEEIPKSFKYSCDRCESYHIQENANGHYSNSCPGEWSYLTWSPQGIPILKVSYELDETGCKLLLCKTCSKSAKNLILGWLEGAKYPDTER